MDELMKLAERGGLRSRAQAAFGEMESFRPPKPQPQRQPSITHSMGKAPAGPKPLGTPSMGKAPEGPKPLGKPAVRMAPAPQPAKRDPFSALDKGVAQERKQRDHAAKTTQHGKLMQSWRKASRSPSLSQNLVRRHGQSADVARGTAKRPRSGGGDPSIRRQFERMEKHRKMRESGKFWGQK